MTNPVPLSTLKTDEDLLAFDIALGLKKAKVGKIEDCQRIGQKVVKQLKLAGWKFDKGDGVDAH